ncbi:FG-GAP-like repeat-containing protein, partial [Zavarzinella formosa]|uniref:FG-GAP-like repeat-containing protein n=1 Tax=Zavarzinella formosa TaxID=360055 RepID=UPI00138B1A00
LGAGDGTFAPAPGSPVPVGQSPNSVVIGDVNGDGKPDLVAANAYDGTVSVLLGNGDGTFAPAPGSPVPVGSGPDSVSVVDVNGDGKPDLVTANRDDSNVSVLLGNGDGTFAPAAYFTPGDHPYSVAIGDVNGDGKPDIVTANYGSGNVSVLLNRTLVQTGPAYTLETPAVVTSVTASGLGITAGAGDLRAGQTVTLTVNFNAPVTVDSTNGLPTLTLNDGATAAYSGGSETTALTFVYTIKPGENTDDLTVTKLNLNGAVLNGAVGADVSGAATNPVGTLKIDTTAPTATITLVGASSQIAGSALQFNVTFSEPVSNVDKTDFALAATGVSGQSITDVTPLGDNIHYTVSVDSGTGFGTLGLNIAATTDIKDNAGNGLGGGDFTEAAGSPVGVGGIPVSVAVGDVNGDGRPDLVSANEFDGTVSVLLGSGNGAFAPAPGLSPAVGTTPYSVAVGDVNGDGKPDLVTANIGSNNVSVLLGAGDGTFAPAPGLPPAVGNEPFSVAVGDVNGDGKPDLVTANYASDTVSVLLGNGDGTFTSAPGSPSGAGPRSVAIGDVNEDGKPDL